MVGICSSDAGENYFPAPPIHRKSEPQLRIGIELVCGISEKFHPRAFEGALYCRRDGIKISDNNVRHKAESKNMGCPAVTADEKRLTVDVPANAREVSEVSVTKNNRFFICTLFHIFLHGVESRSAIVTSRRRRRLTKTTIASAANTKTIAWLLADVCIKTRSPLYAPTYPPTIAPPIA